MCIVVLAMCWVLFEVGVPRRLMIRLRRFLFGDLSYMATALESSFYDDLLAWTGVGLVLAMALDSWQMWSLALGRDAHLAHALATSAGPGAVLGLLLSTVGNWRLLRGPVS
jgi:hypothetical protein